MYVHIYMYMKKQNKANLKVLRKNLATTGKYINKIIKWTSTKTIVNIATTTTTTEYYYMLQKQQLLSSDTTTTKKSYN